MVSVAQLDIYQGDDYQAVVNVTNGGQPVNLAGVYTAKAEIRREPADEDASPDATLATAISANTIALSLAHIYTAGLSGSYSWDLQLTETATGFITTILRGPVKVTAEVTRP